MQTHIDTYLSQQHPDPLPEGQRLTKPAKEPPPAKEELQTQDNINRKQDDTSDGDRLPTQPSTRNSTPFEYVNVEGAHTSGKGYSDQDDIDPELAADLEPSMAEDSSSVLNPAMRQPKKILKGIAQKKSSNGEQNELPEMDAIDTGIYRLNG